MQGYAVGDRHWRPEMERGRATLLQVRSVALDYYDWAQKHDADPEQLRNSILAITDKTPFTLFARLKPGILETLLSFSIEILTGQFDGFSREGDATPNRAELSGAIDIMGASVAERHAIRRKPN